MMASASQHGVRAKWDIQYFCDGMVALVVRMAAALQEGGGAWALQMGQLRNQSTVEL